MSSLGDYGPVTISWPSPAVLKLWGTTHKSVMTQSLVVPPPQLLHSFACRELVSSGDLPEHLPNGLRDFTGGEIGLPKSIFWNPSVTYI